MRNTDLPAVVIKKELELPYNLEEAFNSLRINLNFAAADAKIIMITSSIAGEGKSFVSMHLMKALAESGKRVCLIDADMRGSSMVRDYRISSDKNIVGLSHYLSGQSRFVDTLYRVENIERAYIIPCGAYVINPTILLENDRFKIVIKNASNNFDYVIVDSAPIGVVADAKVISQYCSGALMVIKSGAVTGAMAQNTAEQIEESGCRLLGYILNRKDCRGDLYYKNDYYKNSARKKKASDRKKLKKAKN